MQPGLHNQELLTLQYRSPCQMTKSRDKLRPNGLVDSTIRVGAAGASLLAAMMLSSSFAYASSLYSPWQNGPPQSPNFFPLSVWVQSPTVSGHSGSYPTIADAVAGTKMNIFLGLEGWPEGFGTDKGELEAIKANNLYVVGGTNTPYNENNQPTSVASMLALADSIGAQANLIGYNAGDEPSCGPPNTMENVPAIVQAISNYDSTRIVTYNETAWMLWPPGWYGQTCMSQMLDALQATSIGSFDLYPATSPWMPQAAYFPSSETKSDFLSVPNDTVWAQGVTTQAIIHDGRSGQPAWVFVEAGGDNLGFSSQDNIFAGGVTDGSTTLTNASGWSSFTSTWLGLTVSGAGIPANTTITSIIDATHAVMSAPATATAASESIAVTGGTVTTGDCVASANLCVVNGNEYRPTPAQVFAEVWMSIINGANGIEYFCHDSLSDSFCLGDQSGGAPATVTQENLTYIDSVVQRFANRLNAPTTGLCSMQQINYTSGALSTTTSCANGILTMATNNSAVPGMALVKQYNGKTFLFAQSDRRSSTGAQFTYTLAGLAGHTAEIVYDSNARYDPHNDSKGTTFALNGEAQFEDVLGANGDDYQVKIYRIN